MMFGVAFQVILALLVLSGIIAVLGNTIGRYFGKRRLTLFGLRPRRTAALFTVLSGIAVMASTFAVLVYISSDVRVALFESEKMKEMIRQTKDELKAAQDEYKSQIGELKKIKSELKKTEKIKTQLKTEVVEHQSKAIAFKANDIVLRVIIKGGAGQVKAEQLIKNELQKADRAIKKYNIKDLIIDKADYKSTVSYAANMQDDLVFEILAIKNTILGGNLETKLNVYRNALIYKPNELIVSKIISGKLSQDEAETQIKSLIQEAKDNAVARGLLKDSFGQYGSLSFKEIYDAARRLRGYDAPAKVSIIADADIYLFGDVKMRIEVEL